MTTQDNLEQTTNAAAAWVLELQSEQLSARNRKRFAYWLRESPVNVREYLELAGLWSELEGIDGRQEIDVDALLGATNVIQFGKSDHSGKQGNARRLRQACRYFAAASIVMAVALVAVGRLAWPPASPGIEVITTRTGEQRSVTLSDGSLIYLNTQTTLNFKLHDKLRHVELLAGEALFTVAKDPNRPFIVNIGKAQVRAVGTQFNIRREQDTETVTVVEGKVALSETRTGTQYPVDPGPVTATTQNPRQTGVAQSLQSGIELTAGKQARISYDSTIVETRDVKIEKVLAWTQRRLIFDGATLAEIVEEFNRYNLNRLEIADADLESIRLSGVFDANDPGSLLAFLTSTEPVEVQQQGDGTQIIRSSISY